MDQIGDLAKDKNVIMENTFVRLHVCGVILNRFLNWYCGS